MSELMHFLKHDITSLSHTLLVDLWIVVRRVLTHTHESGCLWEREVHRVFTEIGSRRGLDTDRIVEEVEVIEVHRKDFLLGIVSFEHRSDIPLHWLLHHTVGECGLGSNARIELLCQLLCDGTTTTGRLFSHESALDQHTSERSHVDTRMFEESFVLRVDESLHQDLGKRVEWYDETVSRGIAPCSHKLVVVRIDL